MAVYTQIVACIHGGRKRERERDMPSNTYRLPYVCTPDRAILISQDKNGTAWPDFSSAARFNPVVRLSSDGGFMVKLCFIFASHQHPNKELVGRREFKNTHRKILLLLLLGKQHTNGRC